MSPYRFTCPDCAQYAEVDDPGREATVENGCPFCGRPVGTAAFVAC